MRFSLIVATLNRPIELERLLQSLICQTFKNFEVVIVDQSEDEATFNLINDYSSHLQIIYLHSAIKGLSFARNLGLLRSTGEIIAYPDDDCYYSNQVLEMVDLRFRENKKIQVVSTNSQSSFDDNSKYHNSPKESCELSVWNIFNTIISFTIFIKNENKYVLKFDERFGVGAKFGSGEETDLILRLIGQGAKGYYYPEIVVYHPVNKINSLERGYKYALGFGALHRKHFNFWAIKVHFIIYTFSSIIKVIIMKDLNINFCLLKGKIKGFLSYDF